VEQYLPDWSPEIMRKPALLYSSLGFIAMLLMALGWGNEGDL
jgi:hypothetical protein